MRWPNGSRGMTMADVSLDSKVLNVRCGADTYVKDDGSIGTADKGPLIETEVTFMIAASHDQTLFDGTSGEYVVRKLTPTECERLQGFPDGWTDVPYKGKEHPADTPRYKALGNSMAVPCMRWLGERIQMVQDIIDERGGQDGRPESFSEER